MKRYILSKDALNEEYDLPSEEQEYTSEKTSINSNKLPAIFRLVNFPAGTLNLDYGGGKFDNAAEYLADKDVTNVVYDPYNRSQEHNREVIKQVKDNGGADTATLSNVLNVIQEEPARLMCLKNIKQLLKPNGTLYITVYEGSGTGKGGPTKSGYQRNAKTADYLDEIQQVFPDATRKGKLIICPNTSGSVTSAEDIDEWDDREMYSNRDIPTRELTKFGDKVASVVRGRTGVEVRCTDAYVVDYNRLCLDFDDWDTDTPYGICIGLDPNDEGLTGEDLIDLYLDIATEELEDEVIVTPTEPVESAVERPLEPPEYDEPEHLDATEELEVDLDDVVIEVGNYGDFDFVGWEPEDLDSYEFPSLTVADDYDIQEYVGELLIDLIPAEPGKYILSGYASLAFEITNVDEYRNYFKDEDGEVSYDSDTYTDYAEIRYIPDESSIKVKFHKG